ncbi:Involucrin repeat protein [Aspergillus sclerotialis]|uniref:Involucrin repeat protein n=1 Tax=Aspergillus sclerotialis TaxID=2070753 RepID=A0A3A2ZT46_9EURO|nr:Involucrin repeat protein [Aspergillus sclerotialis]
MFKALMGGNRSSSDVASTSSSKSSRRRKDSKSTVSRKSSRGDDRDRGLGDLSAYPTSGSRKLRGEGDSVASTTDPDALLESDRFAIEQAAKRKSGDARRDRDRDGDRDSKSARRRDRDRTTRDSGRRSRTLDDLDGEFGREHDSNRKERRRTQSGDPYPPPLDTNLPTSGPGGHFAAEIAAPGFSQFPMQYDAMVPGSTVPEQGASPAGFDPHVHQQFPGQFPSAVAEPYRPPNPAGEAADYYGDQGQSVAEQPGVRPNPPSVLPNNQAHLMPASPVVNPPPEPSSMGQVGAAASYFTDDVDHQASYPTSDQQGRPPKPHMQSQSTSALSSAAAGTATYGVGSAIGDHADSPSYSTGAVGSSNIPYAQPAQTNPNKPPHSHSIGSAVGAAATGAAAGYVMGHHHHPSSSPEQLPQYTMQNYDYPSYGVTATPGYNENPALAAGAAGLAGYGAHEMYSHGGSSSQGPPFQSGGLAFQQRQRGPLGRFVDFWRDPEGVGMFEDYTETIGVCRYCFEPGTTSRDAPRHHHYHRRRRSWDRRSSGSRVEKLSRFTSSEEESRRRRKSKKKSWLPGLLAGYAAKSLFSNKGFDDSYSVKSGRVVSPRQSWDGGESASTADRKSPTSRGVYRRSNRSGSYDRYDSRPYIDQKSSRYADPRVHSRSRSRSSSRSGRHSALRDAALGAAVGSAALGMSKSYRRSRSPRKSKSRKESSSSDSSYSDISRPARKSVAGGLASFFTTPSENRKKRPSQKRRGIFSFNNSSSSSLDADLAFGSGYTRKGSRKSKGRADRDRDIDAKLLGLGATAAALAGSSPRNHRRPGEILAAKNSRSRHSDYTPSATNDDGWEDLDSGDQSASSVSSALAFGGDDSQTSDSGTSKWGWRWGGKKDKKKRESISPEEYHTGAALGAGALGGAALASAYRSHSKPPSQDVSSTGSLQPVFPVPTSDPSQFDAARVPSATQPALVRPGPIPLQQPQPVTPVSHAVYTTQGEPAYYTAISEPPAVGNIYPAYTSQYQDQSAGYRGQSDCGYRKSHWRSGSFPVPGTEPFEDVQTTPSLKRRSTTKDQATVQFDLTEEQARKERRANRLEKERRDIRYDEGPQLIDREHQLELEDVDRQTKRRDDREDDLRRRKDYDDTSSRLSRRRIDLEDWERQTDVGKERDSSSWIGAAATGAIGAAAAAATVLSGKSSHEGSSEANQGRYSERREKRRAERRRADLQAESATCETAHDVSNDIPAVDRSDEGARQSEFYGASQYKPHDDYAQFFAPKGLRDSPDYDSWEQSRPRILEREPANERFSREMSQVSGSSYRNDGALSWPIPTLNLIEPTPPQSVNGSTRGAASPTSASVEMSYEDTTKAEKQKSGSRVSWGEHETHEYEAQSTSAKRNAYQPGVDTRPLDNDRSNETSAKAAPEQAPGSYGEDIEFAATVAAATAAAGFDPSLVTDDPTYHKRTSPHGPDLPRGEPHGFVEGEVETSDSEEQGKQPVNLDHVDKLRSAESGAEHFIEGAPIYSEPENFAGKGDASTATNERPLPSDNEAIKPSVEKEDSDNEQHFSSPKEFSMPGGFEPDDSPRESRDRDYLENRKDDSRSVFSAPVAGESETLRSKKTTRSKDSVDELPDNVPESAGAEGMEERKKRRKRRSKRDSGNFDDSASITSSPAKIEAASEKPRSKDGKEKEKGSGGFFSNIFGSRVSEPAEPRRASSIDGRDREVKSEIGTGEREESKRRKKRSSRHRSSDSVDVLDDPRQFEYEGSDRESNRPGEQDDVNIENYKSHRQRREERRRHRYEDIVGSGKGTEYEKV